MLGIVEKQQIEAAIRRCSSKWLLLKISQYSLESTCVGVLKEIPVAV